MAGAQFNSGTYEIYWYKDQTGTPNSPQSPTSSMAQSPVDKGFTFKKAAIIGIGAVVAKRAINTLKSEYFKTTGNEQLENDVNNAMKLLGYAGAIVAGGWVGAGAVVTDVALNAVTYFRGNRRENNQLAIQREIQGKRVNISSGSVYYD